MPPGQTIPMELSYTIAKKVCSAQDFERLACAYLASTQTVNFDAEKASKEFGGCQADSFKRAIWVITKKIKDYKGKVDDAGDGGADLHTPKANGGKKRKADATPALVKTSNKKGRKARTEEVDLKPEPAAKTYESDVENELT